MKTPFAEILNIGDEILYGQITNTNAQWISTELDKIGIKVVQQTIIADSEKAILDALNRACERADIIIITGGLGPTKDDITKKTLCKFFDTELVMNEEALLMLEDFFAKRGKKMIESNRLQATLPKNATYIANHKGTAPGMWFEHKGKIFVSMPGVPHEMEYLMSYYVLPNLQKFFQTPKIFHKMIKTIGVGESFLSEKIADWEDNLPENIKLAYLPSFGMVRLRLTGVGEDLEILKKQVQQETDKVLLLIDKDVYGFDNDDLAEMVGKLLVSQNKTLALAESCSGGYLAHCFTKNSGASAFLFGSVVSYDNSIKMNVLNVKKETLEQFGAVSEETVLQMAENVRNLMKTDIGVAISGIAGPLGAVEGKPVGTIWVAYSDKDGTKATKYQLGIDRMANIQVSSHLLIDWIRRKNGGRIATN